LEQLVARAPEQFVQISAGLAGDISRLTGLRGSLRQKVLDSALVDARKFAAGVEGAYRELWREWCAQIAG
jgi:predicted O-linked N-acetylglucosamine transferase (SPINDLY family)